MRGEDVAVREFAPAKVNLALHVVGRRPDGYHLLDSLVAFADVGDVVMAAPGKELTLSVAGPMAAALGSEDNLVMKAARALSAGHRERKAALRLEKRLPVASGIGGGSSDAAAALRALNRLWGMGLEVEDLAAIGAGIGADVPVCVHAQSARMRGIGEMIEPLALPAMPMLLVNPGIAVSTATVFNRLERRDNPGLPEIGSLATSEALIDFLGHCRNDLEAPAIAAELSIATALEALRSTPGCRLARMSGSGATCFGLYDTAADAETARAVLASRHPEWWTRACRVG